MQVGVVYSVQPEPPSVAHTLWFDAGAVRIGLEHRQVDQASLAESYRDDPEGWAEVLAASPEGGFTDDGVSIHVSGAADGHEYLRFDVFAGEPHYHYVRPSGDHNNVIAFDVVAHGDMLEWVRGRLTTRLVEMLAHAGAGAWLGEVDQASVAEVVAEVHRRAVEAERARRDGAVGTGRARGEGPAAG